MVVEQVAEKVTAWALLQEPSIVLCLLFIAVLCYFIVYDQKRQQESRKEWKISLDANTQAMISLNATITKLSTDLTAKYDLNTLTISEKFDAMRVNGEKNDNWLISTVKDLIMAVHAIGKEVNTLFVELKSWNLECKKETKDVKASTDEAFDKIYKLLEQSRNGNGKHDI